MLSTTALQQVDSPYVLDAERFITSFSLAEAGMLPSVQQLVCPDVGGIFARLAKVGRACSIDPATAEGHPQTSCVQLCISDPACSQKTLMEATQQPNVVGCLVVCLPAVHTGGWLAVHHSPRQLVRCSLPCAALLHTATLPDAPLHRCR